jgi:hypothetical protein
LISRCCTFVAILRCGREEGRRGGGGGRRRRRRWRFREVFLTHFKCPRTPLPSSGLRAGEFCRYHFVMNGTSTPPTLCVLPGSIIIKILSRPRTAWKKERYGLEKKWKAARNFGKFKPIIYQSGCPFSLLSIFFFFYRRFLLYQPPSD